MNDELDIRPGLRGRLKSIDAQLATLTQLRNSIQQTLALEDAVLNDARQMSIPFVHPEGLANSLLKILEPGPRSLEQLKAATSRMSLLKDHNSPGRAINFALVGLQRMGQVRLENELWKLVSGENRK